MGKIGGFSESTFQKEDVWGFFLIYFFFPQGLKKEYKVLGKVKYLFLVVPGYIILFCLFHFKFLCNLFMVAYIAGQNFVLPILVSINMKYVSPEHYLFRYFNLFCIKLKRWYSV